MKLTQIDKKILQLLVKRGEGIPIKEIVSKTGLYFNTVYRRLQKLKRHNIVSNCRTFRCSIYKLDFKKKINFNFQIVECPKCKTTTEVHDYQWQTTCPHPECKTKSGKPSRFWIYPKRVKKIYSIIRERE